ncbi:HIT domain-containing protein [Nonomuraea sp. NPDC004580]|uniref:HIT family protein n=1 Tax=Nonomuraea sp. NPDC004580 TaxID=3154552 RepID=UPI0033B3A4F6
MNGCIFCEIVAGRAEASVVYEDDSVMAILDLHPAAIGHTLVIPRTHMTGLTDASDEIGAPLWRAARRVAAGLRAAANPPAPAGSPPATASEAAGGAGVAGLEGVAGGSETARGSGNAGVRCEGVRLSLADGEAAGQEVFHLHLHVVPRYPGDGIVIAAGGRRRARGLLDRDAALIRDALPGWATGSGRGGD